VAIVNRAFAKLNFNGENPVGKSFDRGKQHYKIIGLARDARYRNMREPITPTAYVPLRYTAPEALGSATFLVRTTNPNPLTVAGIIRREIARARPEFRVSNIRTQTEINEAQTIRERLLAMLALFFAGVGLLLAGIGLYGVLDYSVLQRRREFGIRIAVGAPARNIARLVTLDVFSMVLLGSAAGAGAGLLLKPYIKSLLYQIASSDISVFALPALTILSAVLLAALPAVIRAIRTDAVAMLRAE
jgi:ABC-type lipoprotein release transport system permease subunit